MYIYVHPMSMYIYAHAISMYCVLFPYTLVPLSAQFCISTLSYACVPCISASCASFLVPEALCVEVGQPKCEMNQI